jgi:hypothetical protein
MRDLNDVMLCAQPDVQPVADPRTAYFSRSASGQVHIAPICDAAAAGTDSALPRSRRSLWFSLHLREQNFTLERTFSSVPLQCADGHKALTRGQSALRQDGISL